MFYDVTTKSASLTTLSSKSNEACIKSCGFMIKTKPRMKTRAECFLAQCVYFHHLAHNILTTAAHSTMLHSGCLIARTEKTPDACWGKRLLNEIGKEQVGPALFEYALSELLLVSKSLMNSSPMSAMLICRQC